MSDIQEQLTQEEMVELQKFAQGSAPTPVDQHNVHKFLHEVAESDDTLKTGYLSEDELGYPKLPVRTLKELSLFCRDIGNMEYLSDYLSKISEITTASSLSKNAKLLELAVVNRREIGDITKKDQKKNTGWFKRKKGGDEQ